MNHAAAAFLPSATWMAVWCLAASSCLESQHRTFVVVAVTATLTTGWPFGAVSVFPMAMHILYQEWNKGIPSLIRFVGWIVGVTLTIQGMVFWIDSEYYGVWISPTLNIFRYNAGNSGDELYGIEPTSYYVKNLLLNLNGVAPLGLIALPVYVFGNHSIDGKILSMLLCLPAWLIITVPRPHKEERFLFPIYPVMVYGAVLVVDTIGKRLESTFIHNLENSKPLPQRQGRTSLRWAFHVCVWMSVMAISLSRTMALWKYYSAPLDVYTTLSQHIQREPTPSSTRRMLVCTCGEWYRFPSSFYLPSPYEIGFLPSSFKGQLPQPFSEHGSKKSSQQVLQPFNDQNKEQTERYVQDVSECQFIIDLSDGKCGSTTNVEKEMIASFPFLDGERTSSSLHRTMYLPFLHKNAALCGKVVYDSFLLYKIHPSISS
jgi:alpha-1,2-mannosyltransferase